MDDDDDDIDDIDYVDMVVMNINDCNNNCDFGDGDCGNGGEERCSSSRDTDGNNYDGWRSLT